MRTITPDSYVRVKADRLLADQIVERLGLDIKTVSLIEVSERSVVVESIVLDEAGRWNGEHKRVTYVV